MKRVRTDRGAHGDHRPVCLRDCPIARRFARLGRRHPLPDGRHARHGHLPGPTSQEGDHGEWWFGFALFGWAYFVLVLDAVGRRGFAIVLRSFPFPVRPPVPMLGLLGGESWPFYRPGHEIVLWNRYEILQSILTLIIASVGGIVCWILARRRSAPYREEARRAGRLEFDGEGPGPELPRAARWALRPIASMLGP